MINYTGDRCKGSAVYVGQLNLQLLSIA